MSGELRPANPHLLADQEPFVVATPDRIADLALAPFGLAIARDAIFDPTHMSSAPFLDRLARLDALTFGPKGMPMPRWTFLDAGELPGAIVGLARRTAGMTTQTRRRLRLATYHGVLAPLSMYVALPSVEPATWVGHNLASMASLLPDEPLAGLGALTKAIALAVLRAEVQIGVTQWRHHALRLHCRLGPLDLLSAWTPGHSDPASLTYRVRFDEAALRHLAHDPIGHVPHVTSDRFVESDDHAALEALQARIEDGERLVITGSSSDSGAGRQRVYLATVQ